MHFHAINATDDSAVLTQTNQKFVVFIIICDIFGILLAWLASYYLRFHTTFIPVTKGVPHIDPYLALGVPIVFTWLAVMAVFAEYRKPQLTLSISKIFALMKAHAVAFVIFMSFTYLLSEYRFSRIALIYFGFLGAVYLLVSRIFWQTLGFLLASSDGKRKKIAVVGWGETAKAVAEKINQYQHFGLTLEGIFLATEESTSGDKKFQVLGNYSEITKVVEERKIDQVILALPRANGHLQGDILRSLANIAVDVQLVPDIQEYLVLGCFVEEFEGFPLIILNRAPMSYGWLLIKRFLDIILSTSLLIFLSPLFLVIAIWIKLTSRGAIFYGQERMGLDGITFTMWKFRSMHMGAENETGPIWAKPGDERRTSIGSFLRSTSLDELPQLWNIFRGEMSLVGPRPERPQFVDQFRKSIPKYMYRHKVKAGLTGWAQVNGWRGDTSLEKRIEYDLYYIRNWSLTLDFKILFLTFFKGIINKNAY